MWISERVRRTLTVGVMVAFAAVVAVGCGDDDPEVPTTGGIRPPATTSMPTATRSVWMATSPEPSM